MKQHLLILLVLTGFLPLSLSVKRKFYLNLTPKTWSAAQTYCRTVHTDLATIETPNEALQLKAEANRLGYTSWAWIGLYMDLSDYVWSYGSQKLGTTTYWYPSEPNGGTFELCITLQSNLWFDYSCSNMQPFICIDERNSGTDRYVYYSSYKTWSQARSFCWQYHTDLASARDTNEISIITGKITVTNMATWIGLYKNAQKWSDRTPYTGFTMQPGEPNSSSELCFCSINAQGADAPCNIQLPFFCYKVVTQRRYIRIKIQSNEGGNNSVDRTAVLQKILQKLAEHQITTNVIVMWR